MLKHIELLKEFEEKGTNITDIFILGYASIEGLNYSALKKAWDNTNNVLEMTEEQWDNTNNVLEMTEEQWDEYDYFRKSIVSLKIDIYNLEKMINNSNNSFEIEYLKCFINIKKLMLVKYKNNIKKFDSYINNLIPF